MTAGVKVDPKQVLEHARLADEIDNLTRELDSFCLTCASSRCQLMLPVPLRMPLGRCPNSRM